MTNYKGIPPKDLQSSERKRARAHAIIPTEDLAWAMKQKPSVNQLWLECWASDAYGSRWMSLTTSLSNSAFRAAKKVIQEQNLFLFMPKKSVKDGRRTEHWMTMNLHGSRKKSYWQQPTGYEKFLKSEYWLGVRQEVLKRDEFKCQCCDAKESLQVHHLTYENYGKEHEHLEDLITLCDDCHKKQHSLVVNNDKD